MLRDYPTVQWRAGLEISPQLSYPPIKTLYYSFDARARAKRVEGAIQVEMCRMSRAEARKILVSLKDRSRRECVPSFSLAVAYAGLEDKNRALAYLQKAYEERCDLVPTIKVSPLFQSLHSDRRFQNLLERIGFPS
jgi:hypothetical protein